MSKRNLIPSILFGTALFLAISTSFANAAVMAYAGFAFALGSGYYVNNGFKFRFIFSGIFGVIAANALMGLIHMREEANLIMGLTLFICSGIAYLINKPKTEKPTK